MPNTTDDRSIETPPAPVRSRQEEQSHKTSSIAQRIEQDPTSRVDRMTLNDLEKSKLLVWDTSSEQDLLKARDKFEGKVRMKELPDKLMVPAISYVLGAKAARYHKREIVSTDLTCSHAEEKLRLHFYSGVNGDNHLRQWDQLTILQYHALGTKRLRHCPPSRRRSAKTASHSRRQTSW